MYISIAAIAKSVIPSKYKYMLVSFSALLITEFRTNTKEKPINSPTITSCGV